jgi:hypothetical protein
MAPRARILAFGSAGLLVLAGAVCKVAVGGFTGDLIALSFVSVGLGAVLLLVFLEVGLSEDKAREAEERRRRPPRHDDDQGRRRLSRRPRRPD